MARYIDADKVLKDVKNATPMNWTNSEAEIQAQLDWKCCIALIKNQPTADVAEVEWIDVNERLPEKDGKYLVARKDGNSYSISVRKFRKEVPCWYTGYCGHWERRTNGITHWQPLPEPPSGAKMDGGKEE